MAQAMSVSAHQSFSVAVIDRAELVSSDIWTSMFASERKDHRYYEIIEDSIRDGFDYKYFAVRGSDGSIRAIQPFFLIDQDILEGIKPERLRLGRRSAAYGRASSSCAP